MLATVIYYLKDEKGLTLLDADGDPYLYDVYDHALLAARYLVRHNNEQTVFIWKHGNSEPAAVYSSDDAVLAEWDGVVDDADDQLLHLSDGE